MKNFILPLVLLISTISLAQEASSPETDAYASESEEDAQTRPRQFITLTLGIEQDIKLPPLPNNVSFKGDFKKITQAAYAKEIRSLRLTPTREGGGTLTIHDVSGKLLVEYRIDVKKSKLDKVAKEIQQQLGDIEGINVKIFNNKVIVDGQILLPRDMNRIYSIVKLYGDQASSLVTLSPFAQQKIAEFIKRDYAKFFPNTDISLRAVNDKFIIEGSVNSKDDSDRAEIIAKTYVPDIIVEQAETDGIIKKRKVDVVINLLNIKPQAAAPPSPMIQLVVHYVELQKDYSKGFKFQFTPGLVDNSGVSFSNSNSSRAPSGIVSTIAGTINSLLPKLNWAKEHGFARVLESTTIIVENSKKGEIKSVQNIPYQTQTKEGQPTTSFTEVGIRSSIMPTILDGQSRTINLVLDFGISALIGMTGQGPMTSQSNMTTTVNVMSGQSAAIGGLISNRSSQNFNKAPKDGITNPIISLYASKDFQKQQSQFVVFVTPRITENASAGSNKIKQKFRINE